MTKIIKVKKKNGKIEPFDPEKIRQSIRKAAIDAGYTLESMADPNRRSYQRHNRRSRRKKGNKNNHYS